MNAPKIMGIGCFAKTETLSRVLKRALEGYIPGDFSLGSRPGDSHPFGSNGSNPLKELIAAVTCGHQFFEAEMINRLESMKITGFYLAMDNRCLNLSIFAKGKSPALEKHTTRLVELGRLRRNRLH